jgi:hypothetical protein
LINEKIEAGSVWSSVGGVHFQVISETYIDGNVWIHYRKIDKETEEPKEFSCYKESFLDRFTKLPKS